MKKLIFCIRSFGYLPGVRLWNIPHPAFEDGPDRGFRNVGKTQSDAGEIPRRTYTILKTRRKFEIKKLIFDFHNFTKVPKVNRSIFVLPDSAFMADTGTKLPSLEISNGC
jgi:hypothetical protein